MVPNSHSRWILAAQYFLYFGVMGMYLPFFNLYCYEIGFSGWQIGSLSAARSVVLILFGIAWSILADRFQSRRSIYIFCNFISAALWGLFLMTTRFYWMMAITIAYGVFYAPLISFLEAFAMDTLGRDKKRYGRMRAWGSVAFITVVLVLGRLIDIYSVKIIISLILAGSWVQALVSLKFPRTDHRPNHAFGTGLKRLLRVRVVGFFGCAFLMLASHGAYYAFFSIHLNNLGYHSFFIGLCWALAVSAEIVAMIFPNASSNVFPTKPSSPSRLRWPPSGGGVCGQPNRRREFWPCNSPMPLHTGLFIWPAFYISTPWRLQRPKPPGRR